MIDLHCHILPGLDDGAETLQQALEMAAMAESCGVTAIVATPHCAHDRCQEVFDGWSRLQQALQREQIAVKLLPGMELFGTPDTAKMLRQNRLLTLNGSRYPLVEFDFFTDGQQETRILAQLLDAGYIPLVAHPERYEYLQRDPRRIDLWCRMGCLFQINRGSLMGRFGPEARQLAFSMVDRGFAAVVASDGHSPRFRTTWLKDVQRLLQEEFSTQTAQLLLEDNPRKILQDMQLTPLRPEWFE